MTSLTRSELYKVASARALRALAVAPLLYAVGSFLPAVTMPADERATMDGDLLLQVLRGPGFVVAVAMLLLGVLLTAGEFRHGTISSTLVVSPRRSSVFRSKAAAVAVVAVATTVATEAVGSLLGVAFLEANGIENIASVAELAATVAAVAVVAVLYGVAGVGVGLVLRDQTAAVGSVLAWIGIVEGAVPVVLRQPGLFKWLPSGAANAVLGIADRPPDLLAPHWGALLLCLTAAAIAAAGSVRFRTVDVA